MQALNVEDNTEGLRYEKVILATDADVDGMHIRNLMITYFFRFFEQPVMFRKAGLLQPAFAASCPSPCDSGSMNERRRRRLHFSCSCGAAR